MYARAVYDATAAIQETPSLMRAYVIKAESLISLGLRHAGECRKNRAKFLNLPTNWIMCILLVQMIIFDQTNDHRVLAPTRTPTLAPTAKLTCNDALEALASDPPPGDDEEHTPVVTKILSLSKLVMIAPHPYLIATPSIRTGNADWNAALICALTPITYTYT